VKVFFGSERPSTSSAGIFGLFFSLEDLGVQAGQTVYGYSIFAGDVETSVLEELLNWMGSAYDTETAASNGGLDLVSGGSAFIEKDIDINDLIIVIPEPGTLVLAGILMATAFIGLKRRK